MCKTQQYLETIQKTAFVLTYITSIWHDKKNQQHCRIASFWWEKKCQIFSEQQINSSSVYKRIMKYSAAAHMLLLLQETEQPFRQVLSNTHEGQ